MDAAGLLQDALNCVHLIAVGMTEFRVVFHFHW